MSEKKIENPLAKFNIKKFVGNNAIVIMLLMLVVVVSIMKPNFMSPASITNMASTTSVRFIVALGVSGCLITKGTDLSAGRIAGLSGVLASTMLQRFDYSGKFFPNLPDMNVYVVLLLVVVLCAFIGFINGTVISVLKVPPFLATLGMQQIIYGINQVFSNSQPIGGLKKEYTSITTGKVMGTIPYLVIIALCIGVFMWFLYNKTRYGKYMYAVGGNENAAEVSGINVTNLKMRIYTLAGALYGVAGFLLAAKSGGASVGLAQGYELEAIAACTIGGVSVTGGVGTVPGMLLGVLVFELMKTSLQFLGVDPSYQFVAQGIVIIVAVGLDIRKYTAKK